MSIAKTVKQYLDNKHIIYTVIELSHFDSPMQAAMQAKIPPRALYYPVILRDTFGLIMAVIPASRILDYDSLSNMLSRKVEVAFTTQLTAVFGQCEPTLIPPIGDAYAIRTIIDANLSTPDDVYIMAGDHSRLIKLSRRDFLLLQAKAWLASDFTRPAIDPDQEEGRRVVEIYSDKKFYIRERINQVRKLPGMPGLAAKLFELRADPLADVKDLVRVVEQDPPLAAQVVRYARSPFFGYRGQVDSVYIAVVRVLGFEAVMNLALGVALARPLRMPAHGPLGLESYWRHSMYAASLFQGLASIMPRAEQPNLGLCYLCGLLHDFGFLVLGHLFREEFVALSDMVLENPGVPVEALERQYLGIDHGELGVWLLEAWNMPEEVVTVVREHHHWGYDGPHNVYVRLMRVIDTVLKNNDKGNAATSDLPEDALTALGLSELDVMRVVENVLGGAHALDEMARRFAA